MTYEPDPAEFQQLHDGDPTGAYDCTAESGAWAAAASTSGAVTLQPSEVRRASSEPVPDPRSPGLNLEQVRDAIARLTDGAVRLDVGDPMPTTQAQARLSAGDWAVVQVSRAVLVKRGIVSGFTGPHAVTAHMRLPERTLWLGDPLVPSYVRMGWADLWAAASAFASPGMARVALLPGPRDAPAGLSPASIGPRPDGATGWVSVRGSFFQWHPGPRRQRHSGAFSAWARPTRLAYANRKYPGYTLLSGAYAGWLVFAGGAVKWTDAP